MILKIVHQLLKLLNSKNSSNVVLLLVCAMLSYVVFDITKKVHQENSYLVKFVFGKKEIIATSVNTEYIQDKKSAITSISE